jgi:hypothetical protein
MLWEELFLSGGEDRMRNFICLRWMKRSSGELSSRKFVGTALSIDRSSAKFAWRKSSQGRSPADSFAHSHF